MDFICINLNSSVRCVDYRIKCYIVSGNTYISIFRHDKTRKVFLFPIITFIIFFIVTGFFIIITGFCIIIVTGFFISFLYRMSFIHCHHYIFFCNNHSFWRKLISTDGKFSVRIYIFWQIYIFATEYLSGFIFIPSIFLNVRYDDFCDIRHFDFCRIGCLWFNWEIFRISICVDIYSLRCFKCVADSEFAATIIKGTICMNRTFYIYLIKI